MFDLNLTVDCNGKANLEAGPSGVKSPATSFSSTVNGDAETSSSNEDTCSARAVSPGTFNFDILANNSTSGNNEPGDRDHGLTLGAESGLVTRELFPLSRLGELNLGRQIGGPVNFPFDHGPPGMAVQQQVQARKSRRGPRSRSSQYRGVTFYRRTGRWESHIWDCGKQVYLGGFDTALAAARAYDRAAIKFRGVDADINFNLNDYEEDMKQTNNLSKEEFVHILRRQSSGFSRGSSKYRGVSTFGRWEEARMGQFLIGKKNEYCHHKCNGRDYAVTNFEPPQGGHQISSNDLDLNLGMSSGNLQIHPYSARILKDQLAVVEQRKKSVSQQHQVANKWACQMSSTAPSLGFSSPPPPFSNSSSSSSYPMPLINLYFKCT